VQFLVGHGGVVGLRLQTPGAGGSHAQTQRIPKAVGGGVVPQAVET
jgi:hypothetical protein